MLSLCLLFCHPGCETDDGSVRFLICYIFGWRPKGGAWFKWSNGKYAHGSRHVRQRSRTLSVWSLTAGRTAQRYSEIWSLEVKGLSHSSIKQVTRSQIKPIGHCNTGHRQDMFQSYKFLRNILTFSVGESDRHIIHTQTHREGDRERRTVLITILRSSRPLPRGK